MQAKITKIGGYECAPNGAIVETFAEGSIVSGRVAEWALADGAAKRMFDPRTDTQVVDVPEAKARRGGKGKSR